MTAPNDSTIFYQVVWARGDEIVPMTQGQDEAEMNRLAEAMNEQAAEGVTWYVRKVETVTRPFREVV